jgi:hypothetical protein
VEVVDHRVALAARLVIGREEDAVMPRFAENPRVVRPIEERLLPEGRQSKKDRGNPNPAAHAH